MQVQLSFRCPINQFTTDNFLIFGIDIGKRVQKIGLVTFIVGVFDLCSIGLTRRYHASVEFADGLKQFQTRLCYSVVLPGFDDFPHRSGTNTEFRPPISRQTQLFAYPVFVIQRLPFPRQAAVGIFICRFICNRLPFGNFFLVKSLTLKPPVGMAEFVRQCGGEVQGYLTFRRVERVFPANVDFVDASPSVFRS